MSDSELSEPAYMLIPPDDELEQSLRREVVRARETGNDFTLRMMRTASEKKLGLSEGFYKNHETWKDKSRDIVNDQIENEPEVPSSPVASKKSTRPTVDKKGTKRQPRESNGRLRKKRKITPDSAQDELSSPPSEIEEPQKPVKSKKSAMRGKQPVQSPEIEKEDSPPSHLKTDDGDVRAAGDVSESELSSVIDEEPKTKKIRGRDSHEGKPKKTKPTKAKVPAEEDPDQAEIKRLQGWLVKCGIRKLWGKELKPYETPKAKIKHLKDMLGDAGMTGRYSLEKANQIKEARELAADIEAVKEGEQRWGRADEESADEDERPQKRLVRGAKNYAFLSSDGEETD